MGPVLLDLGWLLFGVASWQAGILPRAAAVLDFAIAFLNVPVGIAGMVLVVAVAWMGLALWREKPVHSV